MHYFQILLISHETEEGTATGYRINETAFLFCYTESLHTDMGCLYFHVIFA